MLDKPNLMNDLFVHTHTSKGGGRERGERMRGTEREGERETELVSYFSSIIGGAVLIVGPSGRLWL